VGTTAVFNTLLPNTAYEIKITAASTASSGGYGGSIISSQKEVSTGPPRPTITAFTITSGVGGPASFSVVIPAGYYRI
jgi:hypothetical protein